MYRTIQITGQMPPRWERALECLKDDLGMIPGEGGLEIFCTQGDDLRVESDGTTVRLTWEKPVQFYRALSLIPDPLEPCSIREKAGFESAGVMFDCSRNAVLKPDALRYFLRKMALMGLNLGMMYTEDTYEVPEQPYFGYKRGRYSFDELREVDDYADMLGIELCPCIQTLGHLDRVLRWPAYHGLRENDAVILADVEESYQLLEQMIRAASAPYRSNKIHIGMDEAYGVGLNAHLYKFGYENPQNIMGRHLKRLLDITDSLGLKAMMWSDMYFQIDGGHYHSDFDPSEAAIAAVDPRITLVYWDYYQSREEMYDDALRKHTKFPVPTVFAGGIWTWIGPAPSYPTTIPNTVAALTSCRRAGVPLVFATAWGDDGQECNLTAALLSMQLYGEMTYKESYDEENLRARFRRCCHADPDAFLALSELNSVPGMRSYPNDPCNACKIFLYQDPLVQLFEKDMEGFAAAEHYSALTRRFATYARENPEYARLFDFYTALSHALSLKCRWHAEAGNAVRSGDREKAAALAEDIPATIEAVEALRQVWRSLWESTNKPYGFEIIDFRMGGICARLSTAGERMRAFAAGEVADIPELSSETLIYKRRPDSSVSCTNTMAELLSASKIDHP